MYAIYMKATIVASKDLDLPTQKEMLAIYRCDEISEASFRNFIEALEPLKQQLSLKNTPPVPELGKAFNGLLQNCLGSYIYSILFIYIIHAPCSNIISYVINLYTLID